MIRLLITGVALSTLFTMTSCDSTVWLDTTLPSLTGVYASGACRSDIDEVDISLVLLNTGDKKALNILPTTRVAKAQGQQIYELMGCETPWAPSIECTGQPKSFSSNNFEFRTSLEMQNLIDQNVISDGTSYVEAYGETPEGDLNYTDKTTVSLEPVRLEYQWASAIPEERQDRTPLLILLLDQSKSNIGLGDLSNVRLASDSRYQRHTFFSKMIESLDPEFAVSMISFAGGITTYNTDTGLYRPTLNRELIQEEFTRLSNSTSHDEKTPLRLALFDAKRLIEQVKQEDSYDPVVVLYTDGVEGEDNSPAGTPSIEELTAFFVTEKVPVHTVQLRSRVDIDAIDPEENERRRAPITSLSKLACDTGGDFLYLRDAEQFSYNDTLEPMLRNRLYGRWSLKVKSPDLFSVLSSSPAPGFMITSDLQATLADQVRVFDLRLFQKSVSKDGNTVQIKVNQRLWLLNHAD